MRAALTISNPKKNTGTAVITSVTLQSAATGSKSDFAIIPIANQCVAGTTLTRGGKPCKVEVTFGPTATGIRSDAVIIIDNASNSGVPIPVSGMGK